MKKSRKGFTLVELLIVIVVIGILSAMMMMSSSESVASAKASNVVTNLRNLKTAALAIYTDHMDYYNEDVTRVPRIKKSNDTRTITDKENVLKYLNGNEQLPDRDDYEIATFDDSSNQYGGGRTWWIVYYANGQSNEMSKIRDKLAGRAKTIGLKKWTYQGNGNTGTPGAAYDGTGDVALQIR